MRLNLKPDLDIAVDVAFDDDLPADEFECLDDNTCTNDGGHVWIGSPSLRPFCIYCGERAE